MNPLLQLNKVSLILNRHTLLRNVWFSVEAQEIHALLGANGSGKSSLAFMVMGCQGYAANTGKIYFDGHDIAGWPIHVRAKTGISLAWQEPIRFEGLTVRDYLHLDPSWEPPEACLEAVGLEPAAYLARMVDKGLSGGERKRVELAAMLAMRPKLAMLDEPAAGVDVLSLPEIIEAIRTLRRGGSAVLLITHQDEIAACADQASQLSAGELVFTGPTAEVARRYRERGGVERKTGAQCLVNEHGGIHG